jgi:hypothetical protein
MAMVVAAAVAGKVWAQDLVAVVARKDQLAQARKETLASMAVSMAMVLVARVVGKLVTVGLVATGARKVLARMLVLAIRMCKVDLQAKPLR